MLFLKMVRDIQKNFTQFLMVFLMVLLSTAVYSGIDGYVQGMQTKINQFYDGRLQDLNIRGSLSEKDIEAVKNIENVETVEGKLTLKEQVLNFKRKNKASNHADNKKQNPNLVDYKLEVNFIKQNNLSKFEIKTGQGFSNTKDKAWVDAYFAKRNNLTVGDKIVFSFKNIPKEVEIAGIIYIPDHVYISKNESEIIPDYEKNGYIYLDYDSFFKEYKTGDDLYSQIMVKTKDVSRLDQTKNAIQNQFGKRGVVSKMREEPTVKVFQGEIDEMSSIIGLFTGFFVLIAILSVATTMTRLIIRDRTKIGTLKALGFSGWQITCHYISYSLFLSCLGGAVGMILGPMVISRFFLNITMSSFEAPISEPVKTFNSLFVYLAIIATIGFVCFMMTKRILRQNATELLRTEQPKMSKKSLSFTTKQFFSRISFTTRWNLRDMLRNRGRVITTLIGIAGAVSLIVMSFGLYTSMANFIDVETDTINNFNYTATINNDKLQTPNIRQKIVHETEGQLKKSTEQEAIEVLDRDNNTLLTSNLFIDNSKEAIKYLDIERKPTELTDEGVYLARKLADRYNLKVGDEVHWRMLGSEKVYTSKIIAYLVKQQNQNLTVTKGYYESLGLKYKPSIFYLEKRTEINDKLIEYLNIQSKKTIADNLKKILNNILTVIIGVLIIAIILGIVIIYNMGALSFLEQEIQFATMKVIGFPNQKLAKIFTWQNIEITIISCILGLPLGYLLADYIYKVSVDDSYDIQTFIPNVIFVISACGILLLSILVSKVVATKIKRIDMVKALKTDE